MPWKERPLKDRSMVVAAWLQASATIGMFVIALIGIWQVTPIITYQIEQQAQAERTATAPAATTVTERYVADAFAWWSAQVASYRRIVDLTAETVAQDAKVGYQLISGGGQEVVAGMRPDLLIVTATRPAGEDEIVSVPVNENTMSPSQYFQCELNQGYFSEMAPVQRQQVETAVSRYLHEYMLPKAPAAFVRPGMSLRQLHDDVSLHQDEREKALEHIQALASVLAKASSAQ
jgi:hypothetical protein